MGDGRKEEEEGEMEDLLMCLSLFAALPDLSSGADGAHLLPSVWDVAGPAPLWELPIAYATCTHTHSRVCVAWLCSWHQQPGDAFVKLNAQLLFCTAYKFSPVKSSYMWRRVNSELQNPREE